MNRILCLLMAVGLFSGCMEKNICLRGKDKDVITRIDFGTIYIGTSNESSRAIHMGFVKDDGLSAESYFDSKFSVFDADSINQIVTEVNNCKSQSRLIPCIGYLGDVLLWDADKKICSRISVVADGYSIEVFKYKADGSAVMMTSTNRALCLLIYEQYRRNCVGYVDRFKSHQPLELRREWP